MATICWINDIYADQDVHVWSNINNSIIVSFEKTKDLHSFDNLDNAINYFYLNDEKELARKLNKLKK
tara:strand:+ start:233 stop:433 length:201 start_codon:yes stop_codon:yes gene_type:complete